MSERKFTDDEIIKAMKHCSLEVNGLCKECPLRDYSSCTEIICEYSLALINRQKTEIERLQKLGAAATRRLVEVKAEANKEIERMKEEVNKYPCRVRMNENSIVRSKSLEDYDRLIGDISAEAIKEFAERLKENLTGWETDPTDEEIEYTIDTLVKEMTEENK